MKQSPLTQDDLIVLDNDDARKPAEQVNGSHINLQRSGKNLHARESISEHEDEPLPERAPRQDLFETHLVLAFEFNLRSDLMSLSQVERVVCMVTVHALQHIQSFIVATLENQESG